MLQTIGFFRQIRPGTFIGTSPIKTALCNACHVAWGICNSISIRATRVGPQNTSDWIYEDGARPSFLRDHPNCVVDGGEWLYDVTCFQTGHQQEGSWPTLSRILLVAEVEWGVQEEVLKDFAKLLVARSEVRVLVYNEPHIEFDQLVRYIHHCADTQPGDTYLLAALEPGRRPTNHLLPNRCPPANSQRSMRTHSNRERLLPIRG